MTLAPYGARKNNLVSRCDRAGIAVGSASYTTSVVIYSFAHPVLWTVDCALAAQASDFQSLCDGCDIVLFGTGNALPRAVFWELRACFFEKRVGFEIMDTAAACRTFNIIAEEGRRVSAFLIIES